jgi:hypothetical protein
MMPAPYESSDYAVAGGAMREILRWITEPVTSGNRQHLRAVRGRALAAAWVISPDSLGGISMTQLAQRIGVRPSTLSAFTSEMRTRFGLRNRYSPHDWRRR